jgi:hypothetical protein
MPRNNIGEIVQTWTFESSSGHGLYETIRYINGGTSCDCPGWTRRVDDRGQRSCKHTRWVEQGVADRMSVSTKRYDGTPVRDTRREAVARQQPVQPTPKVKQPLPPDQPRASRFLDDPMVDCGLDLERVRRVRKG